MTHVNRHHAATPLEDDAFALLADEIPAADRLRERLHAAPDLSGAETRTLETLIKELPAAFAVQRVPGIAAVVRLGGVGPSIALRAEMDALPMPENTGASFAATSGAMHACGHDVHMAAFIAVARAIAALPAPPAPLVGLLQPREETFPSGALELVESRLLLEHEVRAVIGAHVQPAMNSLALASTPGTVNAASDEFVVTLTGLAAHGAYPHLSRDPILAAASFVVSAQQIVARNTDPMHSAVVTVGSIHGGDAPNAIPGVVTVTGTLRSTSVQQQEFVHQRVTDVAEGIARAHGCTAEISFVLGDPPLINDPRLADTTAQILADQGLDSGGEFRSFGADDFAFYGRAAPTLMVFVGTAGQPGRGLHSDAYLPDSDAVRRVAFAMMAGYLAGARTMSSIGAATVEPVAASASHEQFGVL